MAVTEAAKHDLYTYLQETMGDERAETLMAMVSPTGWEDVASKQDLLLLRTELKGDMQSLRHELTATFHRTLRTHTAFTFTTTALFMGLAVTLARTIS